MKKTTTRLTALALSLALLLTSCGGGASVTSMHLRKTEGTVGVSDGEGKDVTPRETPGLYSGYAFLVGVHLADDSSAFIHLSQRLDQRAQHHAGAAPAGPEVHHYQMISMESLFKIFFVKMCHCFRLCHVQYYDAGVKWKKALFGSAKTEAGEERREQQENSGENGRSKSGKSSRRTAGGRAGKAAGERQGEEREKQQENGRKKSGENSR